MGRLPYSKKPKKTPKPEPAPREPIHYNWAWDGYRQVYIWHFSENGGDCFDSLAPDAMRQRILAARELGIPIREIDDGVPNSGHPLEKENLL